MEPAGDDQRLGVDVGVPALAAPQQDDAGHHVLALAQRQVGISRDRRYDDLFELGELHLLTGTGLEHPGDGAVGGQEDLLDAAEIALLIEIPPCPSRGRRSVVGVVHDHDAGLCPVNRSVTDGGLLQGRAFERRHFPPGIEMLR